MIVGPFEVYGLAQQEIIFFDREASHKQIHIIGEELYQIRFRN